MASEISPARSSELETSFPEYLRILLNYRFLASKIAEHAQEEGVELVGCDRVEVRCRIKDNWWCELYSKGQDNPILYLEINENGNLGYSWNVIKIEEQRAKWLAEIKASEELRQKIEDELGAVDFLIQPIFW